MSNDPTSHLKKRCWSPAPIHNDLAEFHRYRIFPRFTILIYQMHYLSISSSAISPSYPSHLVRPYMFPSISQPTIPLSLYSRSNFRGHSMSSIH
jgi:hypothetical protein